MQDAKDLTCQPVSDTLPLDQHFSDAIALCMESTLLQGLSMPVQRYVFQAVSCKSTYLHC